MGPDAPAEGGPALPSPSILLGTFRPHTAAVHVERTLAQQEAKLRAHETRLAEDAALEARGLESRGGLASRGGHASRVATPLAVPALPGEAQVGVLRSMAARHLGQLGRSSGSPYHPPRSPWQPHGHGHAPLQVQLPPSPHLRPPVDHLHVWAVQHDSPGAAAPSAAAAAAAHAAQPASSVAGAHEQPQAAAPPPLASPASPHAHVSWAARSAPPTALGGPRLWPGGASQSSLPSLPPLGSPGAGEEVRQSFAAAGSPSTPNGERKPSLRSLGASEARASAAWPEQQQPQQQPQQQLQEQQQPQPAAAVYPVQTLPQAPAPPPQANGATEPRTPPQAPLPALSALPSRPRTYAAAVGGQTQPPALHPSPSPGHATTGPLLTSSAAAAAAAAAASAAAAAGGAPAFPASPAGGGSGGTIAPGATSWPPPPSVKPSLVKYTPPLPLGTQSAAARVGSPARVSHTVTRAALEKGVHASAGDKGFRVSRGMLYGVFQELDEHDVGRLTYSAFEQAACKIGMRPAQARRLFSQLDTQGRGFATMRDWTRPEVEKTMETFTRLYVQATRGEDGRPRDITEMTSVHMAVQMAMMKLQLKRSGRAIGLERMVEAFRFVDRDGNGSLTPAEVEDAMASLGIYVKPEVVDTIMRVFDKNKNGVIDYYEFVSAIAPTIAQNVYQ